ncbi:exodeoxyribonuclease V subunit alpha [Buchnera aphidicola]|uniref:exodeoxyribonuclease V subunit alpha n=1 Tax=Buchnera aphidicola TaxID=9 RepID=UPI00094D15F2|nr:exodeoxyribonuclease V subunit alpha [Buchnera aphidicola]
MTNKKKIFCNILKKAKEKKFLNNIDFYCCTLLIPKTISEIKLVILYLSYSANCGHSCLPINLFQKKKIFKKKNIFKKLWSTILNKKNWFNVVLNSPFCSNGTIVTPLVIQENRIYLYRYWNAEKKIIKFILNHKKKIKKTKKNKKLFQMHCTKNIDKIQKIAIGVMILNHISFILGGPGTGKTTIITYLIIFFIKLKKKINIKLAAPTGKAAARITEVVYKILTFSELTKKEKKKIPKKGQTLHRLLGVQKDTNEIYSYQYTKKKLSNIDILIIDESSMIDLYMMENITNVISKKTKIIFLGDLNQLPPIEVGSIIKEICKKANNKFSAIFSKKLEEITQQKTKIDSCKYPSNINNTMIILKKKYRFNKKSGIGILSAALEKKKYIDFSLIIKKKYKNIFWEKINQNNNYFFMLKEILKIYQGYWKYIQKKHNPKKILEYFNKSRILCALLDGPFGVKIINQFIERNIKLKNIKKTKDHWYHGRPIMITANNPTLKLFNGEIGICLLNQNEKLKVFFLSYTDKIKKIDPFLIENFEIAWSTTIHKSQGSEFFYVILIFPNYISKILSKELIYTGITRAKYNIKIYADFNILKKIINWKKKRYSGIHLNIFKKKI